MKRSAFIISQLIGIWSKTLFKLLCQHVLIIYANIYLNQCHCPGWRYLDILLEITYRISAEPKICMKSTKNGHSPFSVDFKEMTQESRFEGGHRPKIEIQGSSCRNICRQRDPKCYFDLIPKRKIKNQWKKLETKIPHGVFH